MASKTHLHMQPNIPDLECGPLAYIDTHELGGVLVQDVDVPQAIQQELLADRARHCREKSHGDCVGSRGAGFTDYRQVVRLPPWRECLHMCWCIRPTAACSRRFTRANIPWYATEPCCVVFGHSNAGIGYRGDAALGEQVVRRKSVCRAV